MFFFRCPRDKWIILFSLSELPSSLLFPFWEEDKIQRARASRKILTQARKYEKDWGAGWSAKGPGGNRAYLFEIESAREYPGKERSDLNLT